MNEIGQRISNFLQLHGDFVKFGSWFIFEDGAKKEIDPWGAMVDPPSDARDRAGMIVKFYEQKLKLATEEFNLMKQDVLSYMKSTASERFCPAPRQVEENTVKLQEIKDKVIRYQKRLAMAREKLSQCKPERVKQLEQAAVANRQRFQTAIQQIEGIKV